MRRPLTMCAISALIVGVSLPAAAFPTTPQTPAADYVQGTPQVLAASEAAIAPVTRDAFGVEVIVKEVPRVAVAAVAQFTGSLVMWPASGGVNDGFGYRNGGEWHKGIDIMSGHGASIVAASPGTVTAVGYDGGWGQYVKVDHGGGISTLYAHMIEGSPSVAQGQAVNAGDPLGLTGATGYATVSHLHFEVYVGSSAVDPMGWLP